MKKSPSNAEKVRKKLDKFPSGVRARTLVEELNIGKSALYKILDQLREKGDAFNDSGLWYPEEPKHNRSRNEATLRHSEKLVLTLKDARAEEDQGIDNYSTEYLVNRLLEESQLPKVFYFYQHLTSGYPEVTELISNVQKQEKSDQNQSTYEILCSKLETIVNGVKFGISLRGYCDCCKGGIEQF